MIVMYNDIWQASCGRSGYFSHWPTVLKQAGVDLRILPEEQFWTGERLTENLLDLYDSQFMISTPFMRDNFWPLYRYGMRFYGSWQNAVDASGLGYENFINEYNSLDANHELFQKLLYSLLTETGRELTRFENENINHLAGKGVLRFFSEDSGDGTVIGTVPRSWYPGIEKPLLKLLNTKPDANIELYHLRGEPREWMNNQVKFIPVSDLTELASEAGADFYMKRLLAMQFG
jgi:hypothetical protein